MKRILLISLIWAWGITVPLSAGEVKGKIKIWEKPPSSQEKWTLASSHENAVVFITGLKEPPNPEKDTIIHDQIDKNFFPRVLAFTQGTSVEFRNQDPINHNIFSLSKAKKFDLGLFKAPEKRTVTFDKPGLVKVFCNIHPQMIATFLVLRNNKHFTTGADGTYSITDIPSGNYKLRVWVEGTKPVSKSIVVTEGSTEAHDFEIQVVRAPSTHLNKFGKPYKKY